MNEDAWGGVLHELWKQRGVEARSCGFESELCWYFKTRADQVEYVWRAHSVLQRPLPLRLIYRLIVQIILDPGIPGTEIDLILLVL